MEIILGHARRRWSEHEKRLLVAETFAMARRLIHTAAVSNLGRSTVTNRQHATAGAIAGLKPFDVGFHDYTPDGSAVSGIPA